jgi:hypothetical protein
MRPYPSNAASGTKSQPRQHLFLIVIILIGQRYLLFAVVYVDLPNDKMRQSPRLLQGRSNGIGAGRSNGPQPTTAGSLPPRTPRHPKSGDVDNKIRKLERDWQLGLKVRGPLWSPQKADKKSTAEKVYDKIKRLFFSTDSALDKVLKTFDEIAHHVQTNERLNVLHVLLKNEIPTPISRAGTPLNEPPKSRNVQTCKYKHLTYNSGCCWAEIGLLPFLPVAALRLAAIYVAPRLSSHTYSLPRSGRSKPGHKTSESP